MHTSSPQRQLFSLDCAQAIPNRTVLITALPEQLKSEKLLAEYWESLGMTVESVTIGRKVGNLKRLLEERTAKLLELEAAWVDYVGNPISKATRASAYDRERLMRQINDDDDGRAEGARYAEEARLEDEQVIGSLIDLSPPHTPAESATPTENGSAQPESGTLMSKRLFEIEGKKRPEVRTRLLTNEKADKLEQLAHQFRVADEAVRKRRAGRFKPANVAFVTFADLADAQIAAQVAHYPQPNAMITSLAPDPRDIHWHNMLLTSTSTQLRRLVIFAATVALLFFWAIPVGFLASFLSYEAIKKYLPPLAKLIATK